MTLEQITAVTLITTLVLLTIKAFHYPLGRFIRFINPFIGNQINRLHKRITEQDELIFQQAMKLKELKETIKKHIKKYK